MEKAYFEIQWPREKLVLACYTHDILNYGYNWHQSQYEITLLLHGKAEFCKETCTRIMEEDDLILVEPGIGHASFALCEDTYSLVIRFSDAIFSPLLRAGTSFLFPSCCTAQESRDSERFRQLRFYCAQTLMAASEGGPFASIMIRSCLGMIASTLCRSFDPQVQERPKENEWHAETVKRFISYLENNYASKLTLEDLARFSQYNRTYVSTIFKNTVGLNFHEYLTRLRMRRALFELSTTSKNLTEVAIDNGFSDLKTFNTRFKEIFKCTPSEYRKRLVPGRVVPVFGQKNFIPVQDARIQRKLNEYLHQTLL